MSGRGSQFIFRGKVIIAFRKNFTEVVQWLLNYVLCRMRPVIIANSSFDQSKNSTETHYKFPPATLMWFEVGKRDSECCGLKRRHLK